MTDAARDDRDWRQVGRRYAYDVRSLVVVLAAWEAASRLAVLDPQFFPPPSAVAVTAAAMLASGELAHHVAVTVTRLLAGYAVGAVAGVLVGVTMGWSDRVRAALDPLVSVVYPVPKIVLLPVFFAVLGVNDVSRALAVAVAVFLIVSINTTDGVRNIDEQYLQVAADQNVTGLDLMREVLVPGALPEIFAGLSVSLGTSFVLVVVIGMTADAGLGAVVWNAWELFTIRRLYVGEVTIAVLGGAFMYGVDAVGRWLTPWRDDASAP